MVGSVLVFTATGCHSAFVQTSITNLGPPITTFEVDYPSQSFGAEQLGANSVFKYRFKVQGSGPVKLTYNDSGGKPHTSTGPELNEKSEGTLARHHHGKRHRRVAPQADCCAVTCASGGAPERRILVRGHDRVSLDDSHRLCFRRHSLA